MTLPELNTLASRRAELPSGLTQPEQLFYLSARAVYQRRYDKLIQDDQASRELKELKQAFELANFHYRVMVQTAKMRNNLSAQLVEVRKSGCPMCKKAIAIFDGSDCE
jgi:hypothetical protein